ncbi:hypothetical protein [Mycobacterium sp. C31M]
MNAAVTSYTMSEEAKQLAELAELNGWEFEDIELDTDLGSDYTRVSYTHGDYTMQWFASGEAQPTLFNNSTCVELEVVSVKNAREAFRWIF